MLVRELLVHLNKLPQNLPIFIDTEGDGSKHVSPHWTGCPEDGPVHIVCVDDEKIDPKTDRAVISCGEDYRDSKDAE